MRVTPRTATARVTAKLAPALTPRTPGSASGLRVVAWISAPATPRATPTTMPSSVRSTREPLTVACDAEPSGAVSACHTTSGGSSAEPIATLRTTATSSRPSATPSPTRRRVLRRAECDGPVGGGAVVGASACAICSP
ncbi:hypothetical protein SCALM49S_05449 [Streptomyces californicus]